MRVDGNYGGTLGYEPNSYGEWQQQPDFAEPPLALEGAADHWNHREDDDYYSQPGTLFRLMTAAQKQVLFENTARAHGRRAHGGQAPPHRQLPQGRPGLRRGRGRRARHRHEQAGAVAGLQEPVRDPGGLRGPCASLAALPGCYPGCLVRALRGRAATSSADPSGPAEASMKAGLVGYAQSGKTTLFNALTGQHRGGASRGVVNLGVIKVPDPRIDALSAIFKPRKTTYAEVHFVDVPGPTGKGTGLDATALRALEEVDAFCLVVRGFAVEGVAAADPARELSDFDAELVLHDLAIVEKRLDRLRKEHGKGSGEYHELERVNAQLDAGAPLRAMSWSEAEAKELAHFGFLSRRPLLVAVNVAEEEAASLPPPAAVEAARARGAEVLSLCAALEAEIAGLEPADQPAFLESAGLAEPARARFIRAAYGLLDLVSFFTVGEDEVRAWPIHRGDRAPRAAGRIHSDLERGFIRAEVVHHDDFLALGSEAKARQVGKLRLEGKEYVVKDGDILNIRFAV